MLKVIELFAGIGAYRRALERINIDHEVVAMVENDPKTVECYNAIHSTSFSPTDITTLSGQELPDCDMVCYSPPCQAFSVSGKQQGFNDKRGILFFDALRIIKAKMPKICLMENVKGLASTKFSKEFNLMLTELESLGYTNYWNVLDAKDYGIPQNRKRVFIVSIKNDQQNTFSWPNKVPLTRTLRSYMTETEAVRFKEGERQVKICGEIFYNPNHPYFTPMSCGTGTVGYIGNAPKQATKVFEPTIARTLIALAGGQGGKTGLYHLGYGIRKLKPKEALRIMGFCNMDYIKLKHANISDNQIYKVSGNSIVVDVLCRIFSSIFNLYPEYSSFK